MLLITIPDQYPNYYKILEIYTGYFDSLDIMILFSYPSTQQYRNNQDMLQSSKITRNHYISCAQGCAKFNKCTRHDIVKQEKKAVLANSFLQHIKNSQ